MPPHEPEPGRGATVRAVLYFLASTPFLVILAVGLHFSGVLPLDKIGDLLHGRQPEPSARVEAAPKSDPPPLPPPASVPPPPEVSPGPAAVPQPNQPPRVIAEPRVVFGKGDRTKRVEVRVADETPATGLKIEVRSQDESLIPAAGLRRDGVGPTSVLTVTPAPGKWGDAVLRVTATDTDGLTGEAVIRVTVPAPEFSLAEIPNLTAKRGEPLPPVALRVVDESPVPAKVTFTTLAAGTVLKADGVKVENGWVALSPVKDVLGSATVTVIAASADGREDRKTFTLTITPPPPPPPPLLAAGGKARVAPAGGALVIPTFADASLKTESQGDAGTIDAGTEVSVTDVNGGSARVRWGTHAAWLSTRDLAAIE